MESIKKILVTTFMILCFSSHYSLSFNVGTNGAIVFSGPMEEEFGYTVKQFKNNLGKWLLVGSPWSGYEQNRKGDIYKCKIQQGITSCERLNLQNSVNIPTVIGINTNMSLGLTLIGKQKTNGFMTCGPLWAQQCGSQYFYPGICTEVGPLLSPLSTFSAAIQTCGGPMDVAIILDGSNSIYPWEPVISFLKKLLENLDIGPDKTQVSVVQYGENPAFHFKMNAYKTKAEYVAAASKITQKGGEFTNTFGAIDFTRRYAFSPVNGSRIGAAKVMVVVTDGESHDDHLMSSVIGSCEKDKITRFGIAVLGYYIKNNMDTEKLIAEIKSIASSPTEKYFFNVSEEAALSEIAGTLGDRIFNIEGTGKGGENFQMEMSQAGFSAHFSSREDLLMLGAVGAYAWSGTVVHRTVQKTDIFPRKTFEKVLDDRNHSSLLGYSVTSMTDENSEYYVAGAPRSNHTGQVIVYTIDSNRLPVILDSQRGDQVGSYFGSVLCPLDVNRDGITDLLLVGAPMFMSDQNKEKGNVYMFSVTKGILRNQGSLEGPSTPENARFGAAITAVPDLNLDGFIDVVVGAPLEDGNRGIIYIFNGDKTTLRKQYSQIIMGSEFDPKLQFFGRSLNGDGDMNNDAIPDVSVGAYGKVVQLWSRAIASVEAMVAFTPEKINILSKSCSVNGRRLFCFTARVCFRASLRPNIDKPVAIKYNLTLDMNLQVSRVTSRGLFISNNERFQHKNILISSTEICEYHEAYVQDALDFVSSLSLRVDISLQKPNDNPVLDIFSPNSWEFFIPFSKECGSDDLCLSDLVLNVKMEEVQSPMLVNFNNKKLSFDVSVDNKNENAYNTRVISTYSKNLFYASVTSPSDETEVKCTTVKDSYTLSCQVGYPALRTGQHVTFRINFDFNLKHMLNEAHVKVSAESESKELNPADNQASVSIPVMYDAEIVLTREMTMNFYVVDKESEIETTVNNYDDIGPEFNLTLKVSMGNFPVSLAYLTVSFPIFTNGGNPLLYVTGVKTEAGSHMNCEASNLVNPLKIGERPYTASFSQESYRRMEQLNCDNAKCESMICVLKDMEIKNYYLVNVTARIWNGTFASSDFQFVKLTISAEIKTSNPGLLTIMHNKLAVEMTVSKPGEKGDVPVGVIVGSAIGGLILLAIAVALLWKFGFFKRKMNYEQLMKNAEEQAANKGAPDEVL